MAQYYSEVDYCGEEVRSRPYAGGSRHHHHHGEGERYAVRKEAYEEVDEVALARAGHLGRSGSHRGYGEHLGRRGEHYGHGGSGRRYDGCEERTYDSCAGQYY